MEGAISALNSQFGFNSTIELSNWPRELVIASTEQCVEFSSRSYLIQLSIDGAAKTKLPLFLNRNSRTGVIDVIVNESSPYYSPSAKDVSELFFDFIRTKPDEMKWFNANGSCNLQIKDSKIEQCVRKYSDPSNIEEWIHKSKTIVSDTNSAVTLLLDLDETILSVDDALGQNSGLVSVYGFDCYVDLDALKVIKQISDNGHKLKVVTDANYSYVEIHALFGLFGITLPQSRYVNIDNTSRSRYQSKANYIDSLDLKRDALLIDDQKRNTPYGTLYLERVLEGAFPLCEYFKSSGN